MGFSWHRNRDIPRVPDWDAWSLEVFGDPYLVWHNGPDFSELRRRWTSTPKQVTDIIRLGLVGADPMAAQSAAELALVGGGSELVPDLALRLKTSGGALRVQIARALAMTTRSTTWERPIAKILRRHRQWSVRMGAALALAACPVDARAMAALQEAAASDPEYLVRFHAERSIRTWRGELLDPFAGWTRVE